MKNIFPILEIKENVILNTKAQESYFFELETSDLSQKNDSEVEGIFISYSKFLNSITNLDFLKFYRIKEKSYLNTNIKNPLLAKESSGLALSSFYNTDELQSDFLVKEDFLHFNSKYMRILSTKEFGSDEINSFFIPEDVDYCLIVQKIDKDDSIKKLERIRSSHMNSYLKPKKDIEGEGAYEQAEKILGDLTYNDECLFKIELYFIIEENSLEDLNAKTSELVSYFKTRATSLYREANHIKKLKKGLLHSFSEIIPGVYPSLKYRSHINSLGHLTSLLPVHKSKVHESGITFFDELDQEILFDPLKSSFKNKNMLISGSSGAGKSVLANYLVHNLIDVGQTVILDKGASFRRLNLYHDGEILERGFNPLNFKDPIYLREIILSAVDKESFSKLERGRLLKAIKNTLNHFPKISDFNELLSHLEEDFKGISLYFEDLSPFFTSESLKDSKILYVDIENYPKTVIGPLVIYILEYFKNINSSNKILIFDECWSFLKNHQDFVDECFRTFRKSGAFCIAISQSITDFNKSSDLSSITDNSYFKAYFPQSIDQAECADLDSFDKEKINSLRYLKGEYSECYLKSDDHNIRKSLRIRLTHLELELFHTEAGEDSKLNKFLKDNRSYFNSNKECIDSFVRMIYA